MVGTPLHGFFKAAVRILLCIKLGMCAATLTVQLVPFLPKGVTFVALVAGGVQLVDTLALDKVTESCLIGAFVDVESAC